MPYVPVVMLVAAAAVLAGVIAVALGRGGELAYFQPDYAPLRLGEVSATDVVLFRPNLSLWGYSVPATDEALNRIADALTERDIEINTLRRQIDSLRESPLRLFRDDPGPEASPNLPGPGPRSGSAPARPAVRDDKGMGRVLSRTRGEPSGLGWTDPPGALRFSDDQLSGTTPTGSGFPVSGQQGAYPWSPVSRPPAGRPPWPPAVKPSTGPEPPGPPPPFPHTAELPRRHPSHGPSASSPPIAPSSATDDPPDFPGREPRPPRPPASPRENGW